MKDRTFKAIIGSDNPLETARVLLAPYNMQTLNTKVSKCTLCNDKNKRDMSYGNPNAHILIITDYATDMQDHKKLFKEILDYSKIDQPDIFITSAVKCICKRSDGNYRLPSYTELKNCKQYTDFTIDFVKPEVIISMGATALNQYTPDNVNILENIDKYTCYKGIHTLITYSVRDIFNFSKLNEPTDDKIDSIIETFNKAQDYVNNKEDK